MSHEYFLFGATAAVVAVEGGDIFSFCILGVTVKINLPLHNGGDQNQIILQQIQERK